MKVRRFGPFVGSAVVALVIAVGASAAVAHVSVVPDTAPKGGFEILSFSVPNEEQDANTVKLEVTVPTKSPIAFVSTQPMPGGTSR